jgi:hypothetical protein
MERTRDLINNDLEGGIIEEMRVMREGMERGGEEWRREKINEIIDMIQAKFTSLHLYYGTEITELREQLKNRNRHIQQLESILSEVLEKYRTHLLGEEEEAKKISELQGIDILTKSKPKICSKVQERIRYLNSLATKSENVL